MESWFGRVIKAGFRSFFFTLFLAVVFAPLMTLILIPQVGLLWAPLVCTDGEMSYETLRRQVSDGTTQETTYFCTVDGDQQEISYGQLLLPWIFIHVAFFFMLLWPLLYALLYFRYSRAERTRYGDPAGIIPPAPQTSRIATQSTSIIVNGQKYNSVADMPADARRHYEQAMSALDKDGDGVPDLLQGQVDFSDMSVMTEISASDRLQELQGLRDKGLITETEFQQKRTEILRDL